ncbi:MAG: formylglycine-generating enzyme family protein [Mediterranea sp.]|jgi:formylglycine-generating enzyme required for sulfatase activity|nr:formylglycine-generating enzyme family protein [Mediterranea sp.]
MKRTILIGFALMLASLTAFGQNDRRTVCFASINKITEQIYRISYKLIDVASMEILDMSSDIIKNGLEGVVDATGAIAQKLFGSGGGASHSPARGTSTRRSSPSSSSTHPAEPEMVYVEGGTFWMGCTDGQGSDCENDESPAHSVTLTSFNISKYEVTQGQWVTIMGTNPSKNARGDNYPVTNVSWSDAQEFCDRLNTATGKQYRLPTEAEWEYAARGGNQSKSYKYSGSNNLNNVGWFSGNSEGNTHPVGQKLPNELGIYDMSGNVWEWCSDWYSNYPAAMQTDPMGASSGSYRVLRGGSRSSYAPNCRVAYRHYYSPDFSSQFLGFRLVAP